MVSFVLFQGSLECGSELAAHSLQREILVGLMITLEVNPGTVTLEKLKGYRRAGVNRINIGVQSFNSANLRFLGRIHSDRDADLAVKWAQSAGYKNIGLDLIYGIPNMTKERWKENLQIAFDLGVNHISSYALTVEPKTALDIFIRQGKYPAVSEETALEHFEILVTETDKQDFIQYEISNFGKPNYFSKHNTSYWQGKSYLGIGPSAHSFKGKERSWNVSNNAKYITNKMG